MVQDSPVKSYPIGRFCDSAVGSSLPADANLENLENGASSSARKAAKELFVNFHPVEDCDGSAYVEYGDAKVLCKISGPHEITKSRDDYTSDVTARGILEVSVKLSDFGSDGCDDERQRRERMEDAQRRLGDTLTDAFRSVVRLECYAKSQLDVCVTVVEADWGDGALLAAAITATSVAFVDARIECFDIAVGVVQASPVSGDVTVGVMPSLNQIVSFNQTGRISLVDLKRTTDTALRQARDVYRMVKRTLSESLAKAAGGDK